MRPIRLEGDLPASILELKELLERLALYDIAHKPATRTELKVLFNRLVTHYTGKS